MTYRQFITCLEKIALTQPNIRWCGHGKLYEDLNSTPSIPYAVFYTTPNQSASEDGFDYYSVNAFIIDRLENVEGSNMLQVQSSAKEVLDNIFKTFTEMFDADIYGRIYYQFFYQKFADLCTGCYAIVTFQVAQETECPEYFEDEED